MKAFPGAIALAALAAAVIHPASAIAQEPDSAAPDAVRMIRELSSDAPDARDRAFDGLLAMGDAAAPKLEAALAGPDPETAHSAGGLIFMIRWRLTRKALDRIGALWEGYDSLCPQDRILRLIELASLDPGDAIPLLRRAAEIDPHPQVRAQAARAAASALAPTLNSLNAQGCDLMRAGRFDEAEERFHRMLEMDRENEIALYNLSCSKSLRGMIEEGFSLLERAVGAGYDDFDHAMSDPDLENLRLADMDMFRRILRGGR